MWLSLCLRDVLAKFGYTFRLKRLSGETKRYSPREITENTSVPRSLNKKCHLFVFSIILYFYSYVQWSSS